MPTTDLRKAYYDLLMDQVFDCRYPSPALLDRVESIIADTDAGEQYIRTLMDFMAQERFSSPPMMDRVAVLIDVLERRRRSSA